MEKSTEARREIEYANAEFQARFATGDIAGAAALYTDDAMLISAHQKALTGRSAIEAFLKGARDSGVASLRLKTLEVEADPTSAIEVGHYEMKTADGGLADTGSYMVHWKRQDGGWKLHRDFISTDNPAP